MCEFCCDIPEEMEFFSREEKETGLVYSKDEDEFFFYYADWDDDYYSGDKLDNIKYCPFCGRELHGEE